MKSIGIIREFRNDDRRSPLAPNHVKKILDQFPNINITVQPSKHRCFSDKEYEAEGAIISEDLRACELILGVKEIEPKLLIPLKSYMFFSHTSKIQPDNSAAAQGQSALSDYFPRRRGS